MNKILFFFISFIVGAAVSYLSFLTLKRAVNSAFDENKQNQAYLMMKVNTRFLIEIAVLIFFIFYVKLNIWSLFAGWFVTQVYIKYKLYKKGIN